MRTVQSLVYALCFLTSFGALLLLLRSYLQTRTRLLLWSAVCFVALSANNLLLFVDIILLPDINLSAWRQLTAGLSVAALLYGFVWETD